MGRSYKLLGDGNYIDSKGVAHNKKPLNEVLENDYASKNYVNELIANLNQKQIVSSTSEMTDASKIYLLAINDKNDGNNIYEEYILINGKPELIGTTRIDLTNYVTITQLNNIIAQLEARIAVLESTESEVEVDPANTSDINIWIETK